MKLSNRFKRSLLCAFLCLTMIGSAMLSGCNGGEDSTDIPESNTEEKVEVVRLVENISAGIKVTSAKVETVTVNKADLPAGTILKAEDVIGKFTLTDMYAGEYFLPTKLSTIKISDDKDDDPVNDTINFADAGYVIVSDYVKPDIGVDVSDDIQKLIDENPNRTLYFPDGDYLLAKPLTTSADPEKTVSFKLGNFAHFKAAATWETRGEPLLKLGADDMEDGIVNEGNHYSVEGGIFDGSNVADAIWVMNAGDVSLRYISIKNAVVGIHVQADEEGNGPTADVHTVNIVGTGTLDSIGVILDTDNNTLTNMRIAHNQIAIKLTGSNNFLRNLHPLYTYGGEQTKDYPIHYNQSVAFYDVGTRNFYDNCYNDQFAIGFYMGKDTASVYDCCFSYWYRGTRSGETPIDHNVFVCEGQFNSVIRFTSADFSHARPNDRYPVASICNFLLVGEDNGKGMIEAVYYNPDVVSENDVAADYLRDDPIY